MKIIFISIFYISMYAAGLPKCVYISSYHKGFSWSDGIEKAIKNTLNGKCEVFQFDMDTKRNKTESFKMAQALKAKNFIDNMNPDIVIASDDNAAKYLVSKYYKNSKIPFIFCGVNWTVEKYGFPYKNVTGMIEVTPISHLFNIAKKIISPKTAIFIGDNTITDKKDLVRFEKYSKHANIKLDSVLVDNISQWKRAYLKAQKEYDFIILGHNAAIKGWNNKDIKEFIYKNTKKLSLTTYKWMMEFSTLGLTILPSEQGKWAATSALAVINGYDIKNIAISTNQKWDIWLNSKILDISNIKIPRQIKNKAKKVNN